MRTPFINRVLALFLAGLVTIGTTGNTACAAKHYEVTVVATPQLHTELNKFDLLARSTVRIAAHIPSPENPEETLSVIYFSGVAIGTAPGGTLILSVAHGCMPAQELGASLWVTHRNSLPVPGNIITFSRDLLKMDLCLLSIPMDLPSVKLFESYKPTVGDEVYSVASPAGLTEYPVEGYMAIAYDNPEIYLLNLPVSPGHSGGPVMRDGKLVGIVSRLITEVTHGCFIEPIPKIMRFLRDADVL